MRLLLAIFVSELEIGWNLILAVQFCSAQNTSLHLFETKKEVCLIPKHDIDDERLQSSNDEFFKCESFKRARDLPVLA